MDKAAMPEGKYLASVKLGPKGQIVVPKEVREMFGVRPGDTLLLADVNQDGLRNAQDLQRLYEQLTGTA